MTGETAHAWLTAGEPILGAGGLGLVIGCGISLAWDFFTKVPRTPRPAFSFGRELTGLACGTVGSVAACWLGFAWLGIGPLAVTVPLAAALLFFAIRHHLLAVRGGKLRPVARFAASTALGFLLVGAVSVLAR